MLLIDKTDLIYSDLIPYWSFIFALFNKDRVITKISIISQLFFNNVRLFIEAPRFRKRGDFISGISFVGEDLVFWYFFGKEGSKIPFGL